MIRAILLLALLATPAAAQDRPHALLALLDYHQQACSAQGGTLTFPEDAITPARFFGPEDSPALILDSRKLSCSTAPAMFCADDIGCEINVFQGEAQHSLIVLDWSVLNDEDQEILQVTIAGQLLNKPEPGTYRMTWDPQTSALVVIPES